MTLPKSITDKYLSLSDWTVALCYRGSITHGTWQPSSEPTSIDDKDVLSVCVPTTDYYFGLREFGSRGTQEIKRGEWTLEQVKAEADRLFKLAEEAYIKSTLPKGMDRDAINDLCVDVVATALQERGEL